MAKKQGTHTFKKDRYAKDRGGNSNWLDLYCSACNQHLLLYQKDGQGSLLRLYLDRIFEPKELSVLQSTCHSKSEVPNLKCPHCQKLVATPMVYERENRLAFKLIHGTFMKKKSDGVYPSEQIPNADKQKGGENDNGNNTAELS